MYGPSSTTTGASTTDELQNRIEDAIDVLEHGFAHPAYLNSHALSVVADVKFILLGGEFEI